MGRVLACCLVAIAATSGSQSWSMAESPSTRVISDDSPQAAAAVLEEVVKSQAMLRQITGVEPRLPLRVFALKDSRSLKELAPQRLRRGHIQTFGFSHTGPHTAFIALSTERSAALTAETVRHEYTHVVTAAVSPDAPAWLDEGLAEFWGAIAFDGDRIVAGRPVAKHLEQLSKRKWLPLEAMLKQQRGTLPTKPEQVALFYAQAWAMVHYLLLGDSAGMPRFLPATHELPAGFEAALHDYVDAGRFREAAVPWQSPATARTGTSSISESRALAERASLLVSGEEPRSALPVARQALQLDANEPLALEVMGTYYFLDNQPDQAREWLGRALATRHGSYVAAIYMALLANSLTERERYLEVAIQIRPDSDVAWQHLGAIFRDDGRREQLRRWCGGWLNRPPSWLSLSRLPPCSL